MKKTTITIFLQTLFLAGLLAQDCPYQKYFYWAGTAILDYAEEDYAAANKHFKTAFSKTIFPLGTDLDLALKTAVKTRDTVWAESLAIQLAKGGIPIPYFHQLNGFRWYPQFEQHFVQYRRSFAENFDLALREKLLALRIQDSLFNVKYHLWRVGEIKMGLQELIDGATSISKGFTALVSNHGFPCEQKMGYYYVNGEIQSFPTVVILIHMYQHGELRYKDRLSNIVCDGKLRPADQALLNGIKGFGDSTGIEQEMKIRYERYISKSKY
ncbi:MAG: hypothetical protein IPN33_22440 [Saprospiraceae bacterium]|nr:hypothetical protein [Saprospiraceae bacterium]